MAAGVLERPVEALATDDDQGIIHSYCCDPSVAICGQDIAELDDTEPDVDPTCPDCLLVMEQRSNYCPHGQPW